MMKTVPRLRFGYSGLLTGLCLLLGGLSVQAQTFQTGNVSDASGNFLTFPFQLPDPNPLTPPPPPPAFNARMTAVISNIVVLAGEGIIGGDVLEFDVTIENTSTDPDVVLTAFAFQSKFSESPALASRIGDKLFYATVVPGAHPDGPMGTVKKNGTSNGLFSGKWKGICINSSTDFLPEFNSGLEDESLECAGARTDADLDGNPELSFPLVGLYPGQSQTVRLRLDSGTTDGALHRVPGGTLTGTVGFEELMGPNGITYFVPVMDVPGNVLEIPDFGDNKVLRDADGTFNPTFALAADGLTFNSQEYLTLPRRNFAFTDILGRNHDCETYGLHEVAGTPCFGNPDDQPFFNFLGTGDLIPGIENFAAILHGFGEFVETGDPDNPYALPNYPYDILCDNCGGKPFIPVAEFYKQIHPDTALRQMVAGEYGELGGADQYTAFIESTPVSAPEDFRDESVPEADPGGPPQGPALNTSAVGVFRDLNVIFGGGINGGDAIEFEIDITNTSTNTEAYLTAFNYQTKARGLADIGLLDGFTQDRRDIRLDSSLEPCLTLSDSACWNATLGIGHFPNVIGNGLLFGQMVWTNDDAGREGPVINDQVYVDPVNGKDPVPYWLESVKKNGPFSPILKGNVNFICVKSGLFDNDPDADAACAGEPAILIDPDGLPIPSNITQRLGLPPGETQTVRIRMEFGDFRGAMLKIVAGTLVDLGDPDYGLKRDFDCSDQRELEYAHPDLVGVNIGYLPNTDATWLTPETLEEIEYVIINQPGDAPTVMNFQQNFGYILAMSGFIPSAEFYAPDPNPDLVGTSAEGVLIQQQVLGTYEVNEIPSNVTVFSNNK